MIQISPYHPEIDAVWQAVFATGARSVAVVAAEPGEGTTLIADALARRAGLSAGTDMDAAPARASSATAVLGARAALLVDLDIGRRSVGRLLGLRPAMDELVRLDAMGLGVLAHIGPAATEAWRERSTLAEQLKRWQADWSLVVLDTAPVLSGDADEIPGTTAAAAADVCLLVTLAGRTPGNRIREARDKLAAARANLIGSVLNDRDNPSLLAELERETYRFSRFFPRTMAGLRARMHRSPVLSARI